MPTNKEIEAIRDIRVQVCAIEASNYLPYELKRWMEIRLIANKIVKYLKEKQNANH